MYVEHLFAIAPTLPNKCSMRTSVRPPTDFLERMFDSTAGANTCSIALTDASDIRRDNGVITGVRLEMPTHPLDRAL